MRHAHRDEWHFLRRRSETFTLHAQRHPTSIRKLMSKRAMPLIVAT
jgi:hypothetical protein